MKTLKIELTEDEMSRLIAYTKADNHSMGNPNYRTCEEMASFLVALMTERNNTPFLDDKEVMEVYNKEYERQFLKNKKEFDTKNV